MTENNWPQPIEPVQSPLAGLDQAIPQILYGNGSTTPRPRNVREDALVGATIGGLIAMWLHNRRMRKQQH